MRTFITAALLAAAFSTIPAQARQCRQIAIDQRTGDTVCMVCDHGRCYWIVLR